MAHNGSMKVGFIGLGHMGAGMAGRLLQAGCDVTVYNRTPGKAEGLIDRGAHLAARVADACRGDGVITMRADDGAVEGVVFGEEGVLQSLGKGAIHLSMSTISVALSERLAAAHASAGQRFVAAPVFGRPDAAETLRVPMPLASLVHDRFLTLIARGGEALDWSALGQLAANDAGLGDAPITG